MWIWARRARLTQHDGSPACRQASCANARSTGWFVDLTGTVPIGAGDVSPDRQSSAGWRRTPAGTLATSGTVALAPGARRRRTARRESNWKYGAGAQYEINKSMIARGEVELYRKLGKEGSLGENDVGRVLGETC
jgi:hypothetical protein